MALTLTRGTCAGMTVIAIAGACFFPAIILRALPTPRLWPAGCVPFADPGAGLPGGSGPPALASEFMGSMPSI